MTPGYSSSTRRRRGEASALAKPCSSTFKLKGWSCTNAPATSPHNGAGAVDMVPETKRCTAATRAGRLTKARQFLLAAQAIATIVDDEEIADAFVTLCVHAGIAAADVICCAKLGRHHDGPNHSDAIALLATVDRAAAQQLKALLAMKTRSGYSPVLTSAADQKRAGRAAASLVNAATAV